jgi:membrane protease YdiL (CAAX protease family)
MATTRSAPASTGTVLGLVAAIAVADVVGNVLVPEAARVPIKLVIVVALVGWSRRQVGLSWDELGLAREHVGTGLRLGGIAAGIVAAVLALLVIVPGTRSSFESSDIAHASTTRQVLMVLVIIPVGTAIFEETIFRGVLLGVLLRAWTRRTAVVVSSVLFGFWHLVPALSDASGQSGAATIGVVVGTIAVTTVAGVVLAWLRLRSGSLAAPVLAHIATNSLTYLAVLFVLNV